jgi:hypothetical protein
VCRRVAWQSCADGMSGNIEKKCVESVPRHGRGKCVAAPLRGGRADTLALADAEGGGSAYAAMCGAQRQRPPAGDSLAQRACGDVGRTTTPGRQQCGWGAGPQVVARERRVRCERNFWADSRVGRAAHRSRARAVRRRCARKADRSAKLPPQPEARARPWKAPSRRGNRHRPGGGRTVVGGTRPKGPSKTRLRPPRIPPTRNYDAKVSPCRIRN